MISKMMFTSVAGLMLAASHASVATGAVQDAIDCASQNLSDKEIRHCAGDTSAAGAAISNFKDSVKMLASMGTSVFQPAFTSGRKMLHDRTLTQDAGAGNTYAVCITGEMEVFGPEERSALTVTTAGGKATCSWAEFAGGFDGFPSRKVGDGHEEGLDAAIMEMFPGDAEKQNAFLADMIDMGQPINLDFPQDRARADGGERLRNIGKLNDACTALLTLSCGATPSDATTDTSTETMDTDTTEPETMEPETVDDDTMDYETVEMETGMGGTTDAQTLEMDPVTVAEAPVATPTSAPVLDTEASGEEGPYAVCVTGLQVFGPEEKSALTLTAEGGSVTCSWGEYAGGFDGYPSRRVGDGHEKGLDMAIEELFPGDAVKQNAFLADMIDMGQPINLDFPQDKARADGGERLKNIGKLNDACTALLSLSCGGAPSPMAPSPMAPSPMAPSPMAPQPMMPEPMAPKPMASPAPAVVMSERMVMEPLGEAPASVVENQADGPDSDVVSLLRAFLALHSSSA